MADGGKIDWRHTKTRRGKFLRVLAETYDVEEALTQARLTWPEVCELRVRYPEFADRFEQVIAAGYDRLEALLLREAGLGRGGTIDLPLAQAMLKQRRAARVEAAAGRTRRAAQPATRSEKVNEIVKQFELLRAGQVGRGKADGKKIGGRAAEGRAVDAAR
jgi:hypothetical protein